MAQFIIVSCLESKLKCSRQCLLVLHVTPTCTLQSVYVYSDCIHDWGEVPRAILGSSVRVTSGSSCIWLWSHFLDVACLVFHSPHIHSLSASPALFFFTLNSQLRKLWLDLSTGGSHASVLMIVTQGDAVLGDERWEVCLLWFLMKPPGFTHGTPP